MTLKSPHHFHIPVMGIGFTIDSPIKVAHFGINAALSIVDDVLPEQMRKLYCTKYGFPYTAITEQEHDYRAKRITAYLNLIDELVKRTGEAMREEPFTPESNISKYFELLPDDSDARRLYLTLPTLTGEARTIAERQLRDSVRTGAIEVNIMTKVDKAKFDKDGQPMAPEFSDALSALRGFGNSTLSGSVIFSAGLNPRLYSYCEAFPDFYPDANGNLKKKIILKVSDYRSALIQGKIMAKKGLWVSEYRIESGLNCGGHAFATEGLLMGPILEEFKNRRQELISEVSAICNAALIAAGKTTFASFPELRITAQGGIGTADENRFLLDYYELSSVGWGSPFLLVPEVTNVDEATLKDLSMASPDDFYLSHASPLGVPFNNFRRSSSERQRLARIEKGKAGSPCLKKFLQFNTEFTKEPICTASTKYQYFKLKQLNESGMSKELLDKEVSELKAKDCLCEGLSAPALMVNQMVEENKFDAVAICPGPNLAFFSGVFSLQQMVDHIYGRQNVLNKVPRPNLFVNELLLYVKYLINENTVHSLEISARKEVYLNKFRDNLLSGIQYYHQLADKMETQAKALFKGMKHELSNIEDTLHQISIASLAVKEA